MNVDVDLVPEADYFTKLNTELAGGTGKHDAFMLGAYSICSTDRQAGSKTSARGWRTPRPPVLITTSRTSSRGCAPPPLWDFTTGQPLGTGGQWAIPWGFENNVVAYNKAYFDQRGITKSPDRFVDLSSWPSI